jgi:hypothetical protein
LSSFLRALLLSSRLGRNAETAEEGGAGPGAVGEEAAAAAASAMEGKYDDGRRTTIVGDPDRPPPPAKEKKRRTMLFVSFPLEKSKPGRSPLALSAKEGSRDEQ